MASRRKFIESVAVSSTALTIGGATLGMTARIYKNIIGANDRIHVAMFDEIDEGTAIYKCLQEGSLPQNGDKKFVGIESNLATDYYLWLTGKAGNWFSWGRWL